MAMGTYQQMSALSERDREWLYEEGYDVELDDLFVHEDPWYSGFDVNPDPFVGEDALAGDEPDERFRQLLQRSAMIDRWAV